MWCHICRFVVEKEFPITVYFKRIGSSSSSPRNAKVPWLSDSKTTLALASTCRWMYNVATPIYYSQNTFSILTPPMVPDMFFAAIGPRNLSLITSLEIHCNALDLAWRRTFKLTALKNVSVFYPERIGCVGREPERWNLSTAIHYSRLINQLPTSLKGYEDPLERLVITGETVLSFRQRIWYELEETDEEGVWTSITYSWGVVTVTIHEKRMTVNIKRKDKEGNIDKGSLRF